MTLSEFYVIAAPLVAAVGCGHTRLVTPGEYWMKAGARYFPLKLKFFGNRAYLEGGTDPSLPFPRGSEIVSINGRKTGDILAQIKPLVPSDGANDGNKMFRIDAAFAPVYAHRFGFADEFIVEALAPGAKDIRTVRLPGVAFNQIPANGSAARRPTSSGDPDLDFEILREPSATAVLTIRNFSYYREVDKFKKFVDGAFSRIREAGIANLILDLRDNGGGDPFCTTHLLGYLEPKPVPYFARVYPGGYEPFAEPIPRAANAFEGNLFVLINEGCFSSTGHLTALFKEHGIGTLVGSETGGTYECNDASREIVLDRTGLRLVVARMTFTAAVKSLPRYRGVLPDVAVPGEPVDYFSGKDTALEAALTLVRTGK